MRKLYFLALIIGIPLVILGASHAHTLASENYFDMSPLEKKQFLNSTGTDKTEYYDKIGKGKVIHTNNYRQFTGTAGLTLTYDYKVDFGNVKDLSLVECDPDYFTYCKMDLNVRMHTDGAKFKVDEKSSVDGIVVFSHDDVKKMKEKSNKVDQLIGFKPNGFVEYQFSTETKIKKIEVMNGNDWLEKQKFKHN